MPATDAGALAVAKLLKGDTQTIFGTGSYLSVGDSTTTFAKSQTDLQATTNKLRMLMDSGLPTRAGAVLTYSATYAPTAAVWVWAEWGVFNAASGGDMLSRKVEALSAGAAKPNNQTWQLVVDLAIGAA